MDFDEYQKLEYENVAEAHFKTIDAISSFFRYYLIIMSLPATAAALILSRDKTAEQQALLNLVVQSEVVLGPALMIVATVGLCLMLYVLNLRMDGILYARTVNAIRKYFYDSSSIEIATKQQLRVLPQTRFQPPYNEPRYFWPVVLTFVFLNTSYFVAGFSLWSHSKIEEYFPLWPSVFALGFFAALHFLFYSSYARHRELGYLETSAIGIDIDGVLNKHREHFCEILKLKTGKTLHPDQIRRYPVRENRGLGIKEDDENAVFHDPTYWTNMPVMAGAEKTLRKLQNDLNLKIYIFSYRPWPVPVGTSAQNSNFDSNAWTLELRRVRRETKMSVRSNLKISENIFISLRGFIETLPRSVKDHWLAVSRTVFVWLPWAHLIDRMTHVWLYQHQLQYDRLIIEKGHTNLASPNAKFENRFNMARRYNLRFFIEDDLEKAVKMAHICDVVFLIDHPYNQMSKGRSPVVTSLGRLPANIERVKSWDELYRKIRQLS